VTEPDAVPTGNTYDKYASTNPIERRLMAAFLARLQRSLPSLAPSRILEVGVGEGEVAGRIAERYPAALVAGIDLPDPTLADQWASRSLPAAFGHVTALPFPDRCFDLVLAIEVLEHVARPEAAVREIVRVATGDVVLSVPREPLWRLANVARGKYLSAYGNTPGHIQHWSRRAFVGLVARHLDVTAVHSPTPWTMVAARVRR
jgi:ubiquinone/menaquinone biosynthesis C-methylase UbiE